MLRLNLYPGSSVLRCCSNGNPLHDVAGDAPHLAGRIQVLFRGVRTQLRYLAVAENTSVQTLLAEAIDLLFQARGVYKSLGPSSQDLDSTSGAQDR